MEGRQTLAMNQAISMAFGSKIKIEDLLPEYEEVMEGRYDEENEVDDIEALRAEWAASTGLQL